MEWGGDAAPAESDLLESDRPIRSGRKIDLPS
jgi:hypothetical protein